MRIRLPFAAGFFLLCLLAAYIGLSPLQLGAYVNDKALHFATFFLLTTVFYWIVDASRRRVVLNLTVSVCTLGAGVGSEFVQAWIPNGRDFDALDIVANVLGSAAGVALCAWYHKRMLDRKKLRRYRVVGGGGGEDDDVADDDLELGEMHDPQEEGVVSTVNGGGGGGRTTSLEEEVDNWDENALDNWDEDDDGVVDVGKGKAKEADLNGGGDASAPSKKRVD